MRHHITPAFLAFLLILAPPALAEQGIRRITLDGRHYQITVSPEETKKITFYAISKGKSSQPVALVVQAPAGAKVKASMDSLRGEPETQSLASKGFSSIALRTRAQLARDNACLSFAPGEQDTDLDIPRPESNSPLCDLFSEADKAEIAEGLSAVYGGTWSSAQVCGYLVQYYFGGQEDCDPADPVCLELKGTPVPLYQAARSASSYEFLRLSGLIRKDACASKKSKYLVRFVVDLTHVDPAEFPQATISIQASEYAYKGNRAASIKPVSDGRFAPQPILIMTFVGSTCGQKLSLVKWRAGRPRSITNLTLGDLIPYKGRIMTRSPIGRALTGGKGTFDLYSASAGYGLCFDLVKRRQKINGY